MDFPVEPWDWVTDENGRFLSQRVTDPSLSPPLARQIAKFVRALELTDIDALYMRGSGITHGGALRVPPAAGRFGRP